MFKFVVFCCVIAVAVAKPGILSSPLRVAAAPTIVSAPAVNIVRTAPIAFNTIAAPLTVSSGLVSHGLVSNGLLSHGLVSNGLISSGLVSKGVVTDGLVATGSLHGGLVSTKFL